VTLVYPTLFEALLTLIKLRIPRRLRCSLMINTKSEVLEQREVLVLYSPDGRGNIDNLHMYRFPARWPWHIHFNMPVVKTVVRLRAKVELG
jgi:hypothetical protein